MVKYYPRDNLSETNLTYLKDQYIEKRKKNVTLSSGIIQKNKFYNEHLPLLISKNLIKKIEKRYFKKD